MLNSISPIPMLNSVSPIPMLNCVSPIPMLNSVSPIPMLNSPIPMRGLAEHGNEIQHALVWVFAESRLRLMEPGNETPVFAQHTPTVTLMQASPPAAGCCGNEVMHCLVCRFKLQSEQCCLYN